MIRYFITSAFLVVTVSLSAQNFLGAWGGGGKTQFLDYPARDGFKTGYRYGVMGIGMLWQNQLGKSDFYFHTGFDWEQKGGRVTLEESTDTSFFKFDNKIRYVYLTLPLQIAYHLRITKSVRLIAAPGMFISRLAFNENETYRNKNGVETWATGASEVTIRNEGDEVGWDLGFLGTAMLQVKAADYLWLQGGYRYAQSLTRLFEQKNDEGNPKNLSQMFFFGITYNTSALY